MSEIPEIVALRRDRVFEPYPEATHLVRLDDAERELRSALDRQARELLAQVQRIDEIVERERAAVAREIVEYVDSLAAEVRSRHGNAAEVGSSIAEIVADGIRARFAPKEADPR